MAKEVSFEVSDADHELIQKIVDRTQALYRDMAKETGMATACKRLNKRQDIAMDITACHANGNPLRLEGLLAADDFNFMHDVFGIRECLDRRTGKLTGFFSPRFSDRTEQVSA